MDPTSSELTGDEMSTQAQDEVVLAAGENPGESVAIPARLLPAEYRTDGRLRVVASVDRGDILGRL